MKKTKSMSNKDENIESTDELIAEIRGKFLTILYQ
jgi:hypothetical protein